MVPASWKNWIEKLVALLQAVPHGVLQLDVSLRVVAAESPAAYSAQTRTLSLSPSRIAEESHGEPGGAPTQEQGGGAVHFSGAGLPLPASPNLPPLFEHSDDFRTLQFRGQQITLTSMQAQVVAFMFQRHQQGEPEIHQARILTEIESSSKRLHELFKRTEGVWNTLIIEGSRKGMRRLDIFD